MKPPPPAPRIASHSWGTLQVEGQATPHKDAKLFPGGSREWDWNETGTRHTPGIQPADIQELLDHGAAVLVLSQGVNGRLQVSPQTLQLLEEQNIPVHILKTPEAVNLYNQLIDEEPVGALIHSTC